MAYTFASCLQKVKGTIGAVCLLSTKGQNSATSFCLLYTKSQSVYHRRLLVVDEKSKCISLPFACCTQKVKDGRPGKEA